MIRAEPHSTEALIRAASRGDATAFNRLFDEYSSSVFALALAWTGDESTAEEVLQDSFMRVWTRLKRLNDPQKFKSWLWRIVVNCARDAQRSKARKSLSRFQQADVRPTLATDHADDVANRLLLQDALARLPTQLRAAVSLYYLADLSERDTASVLGWRIGTLKSRLHRARTLLTAELRANTEEARP